MREVDMWELCEAVFGSHDMNVPLHPTRMGFVELTGTHIWDEWLCICRRCNYSELVHTPPGKRPT